MISNKNFIDIWNNIKKIPLLKKRVATHTPLNDSTALPLLLSLFKKAYRAYSENNHNSWHYQISRYNFNETDKSEIKKELVKQYNHYLYELDKENPWVIDERDKQFIKIIRKRYLESEERLSEYISQLIENELTQKSFSNKELKKRRRYLDKIALLAAFTLDYDEKNKRLIFNYLNHEEAIDKFKKLLDTDQKKVQLKIKELKAIKKKLANNELNTFHKKIRPILPLTPWEEIAHHLDENSLFKFINAIWIAISSHANLLRWISFTLIFFSLPFPNIPLVLFIAGSIVSYLIFRFFFLISSTNTTTLPNLLEEPEKYKTLDLIKQEVFNQSQYKKQFSILQDQLLHLDIKIENLYKNISLQIKKNYDNFNIELESSSLYQHLNQVYPKTQFSASLLTKFISITLYAYLISWATSICCSVIGAVALAGLISNPLFIGPFILILTCLVLIGHLIQYRARKNNYQRTIITLLKEDCELSFVNEQGEWQKITLERWKKFEYLNKEIQSLEKEVNQFIKNNPSSKQVQKIFFLFDDYLKNNDIYKPNIQDKSLFIKIKKILNRLFSFSAGGFYGFNLGEQIAFESSFGFKGFFRIISLPLYIGFFLPLIVINGIANLLTYHLNSRQCDLLFFAEHLDSKLQLLEYRRKILSYLSAISQELDTYAMSQGTIQEDPRILIEEKFAYLDLAVKKTNVKEYRCPTQFFKPSTHSLTSPLLKQQNFHLPVMEINETHSYLSLTR